MYFHHKKAQWFIEFVYMAQSFISQDHKEKTDKKAGHRSYALI